MSSSHQQSLPFLTKPQPDSQKDAALPQGECTFLKPQVGRSPLRCDCVAFTLDKDRPGAVCGCGHAAWTHVREQVGDGVKREEFSHLVREMRDIKHAVRDIHDEVARQKTQREKENQQIVGEFRKLFDTITRVKVLNESRMVTSHAGLEQRIAQVSSHATHLEDRIEAIVDKTQNWDRVVEKVEILDEACMSLEERVEKVDNRRAHQQADLAPVPVVNPEIASQTPTAAPLEAQPAPNGWEIRVVLVPKRTQRFAFTHDSVEWRRSYSRGLHQTVTPASHAAEDFNGAVESAFKAVLQNRPWAPLVCLSSQDKELSQLPPGQAQPHLWDYAFLEKHCFASDKLDGDIVYIAPTQDELPWSYINSLARVPGAEETCWEHNVSLDGFGANSGVNFSRPQTARSPFQPANTPFARPAQPAPLGQMDSRMIDFIKSDSGPAWRRKPSLDSDANSMYENSPPPYSTRMSTSGGTYTPSGLDSRLVASGLNILAITALGQSNNDRPGAGQHPFDPQFIAPRPATSAGPGERSMTVPPQMPTGNEMEIDDDGIRDFRGKSSDPNSLQRSGSGSTSNSREAQPPSQPQQQYYFTGRSKRRVTTGKYKEPVELSISSVKLPRLGFHKHSTEEKGKAREDADS